MNKSPCLNCESRKLGCHDRCSKYQSYKKVRNRKSEKLANNMDINGYVSDAVDRMSGTGRGLY